MNKNLKTFLLNKAHQVIKNDDPSHDVSHALRVLALAEEIAKEEKADLEIVIPAALFHDVIVYPKNHPDSKQEADESAEYAGEMLAALKDYPKEKIERVKEVIRVHSFSKGLIPTTLEGKIVQDADRLEATGAISIMRTFSSGGQMKIKFYNEKDPFCEKRKPEAFNYSLDLFYERLLKVGAIMHTKRAKQLAQKRTEFLEQFLEELRGELAGKR